jgi:hypothetical protein
MTLLHATHFCIQQKGKRTMALLLLPSGESRQITSAQGKAFSVDELQHLVGGWIEMVKLPDGRLMCVNEDGKVRNLAYNQQATKLARPRLRPGDYIVGAAVVMTRTEAGE